LAYKDWCRVQDLTKEQKGLTLERIKEIKTIKAQFNSKRKVFDFTHLDSACAERATNRPARAGRPIL
jgi:hypothetical protein